MYSENDIKFRAHSTRHFLIIRISLDNFNICFPSWNWNTTYCNQCNLLYVPISITTTFYSLLLHYIFFIFEKVLVFRKNRCFFDFILGNYILIYTSTRYSYQIANNYELNTAYCDWYNLLYSSKIFYFYIEIKVVQILSSKIYETIYYLLILQQKIDTLLEHLLFCYLSAANKHIIK